MLGFILRGVLGLAVITMVVSVAHPANGQVRTWTDSTGKFKTQAEFVSFKDGKVTIRQPESEKTVTIPLEKLSEVDKRYVRRILVKQRSEQRAAERKAQEAAEEAERTGRAADSVRSEERDEDIDDGDEDADEEDLDEDEDAEEEDRPTASPDTRRGIAVNESAAARQRDEEERLPSRPAPRLTRPTPNNFTNSVRGAVYRAQVLSKMKQINLALINYESQRGSYPAYALRTADGKPGLSWRVAILPMLDEDNLYRQFKLDEPWDSPHNKPLVDRMPSAFKSPGSDLDDGYTNYLAVVGPNTVITSGDKPASMRNIRDGTSNTIMIVEADDAYAAIWTKPDDYVIDPDQPLYGLGGIWTGIFYAGLADGSVLRIPASADPDSVNAWFGRDDGSYVPIPKD